MYPHTHITYGALIKRERGRSCKFQPPLPSPNDFKCTGLWQTDAEVKKESDNPKVLSQEYKGKIKPVSQEERDHFWGRENEF